MGPVDTNNPVQVNVNGKLPPQQIGSSSASLKENQIELVHPKTLGKFVIPPYQYWSDSSSNSFDKNNEPRQHILLPNFPSLLNQNINLNNSPYAAQHNNWSASQFQAPQQQDIHLSMNNKNQLWEGVNNHSSVPSSPDHIPNNSTPNIIHNNGSSSNVNNNSSYSQHAAQQQQQQQQQQHHQQHQQQSGLQSHYTTPNSSPILSPNTYIQHQQQQQHQHQQQFMVGNNGNEEYDRDLKRKTPLKSIPQQSSVLDFNHLTVAAYLHQQQMEMSNKKQKSSINHETSSLPTTPHSFELERSNSLSSFNFAPRSELVASSSSAPTTPHHNSAHHTPSSIRSISPEMSSYIHQHQQQPHHQQSYSSHSHHSHNSHNHNHPHHFSAPSSPNHHPISLPLLLTASASLPATPTLGSTPSFDHTALSFSANAAINNALQSSAPVCSCLASKHIKPLSPSDTKALALSGQTPATLECEEFNVPLEYFEEWMETEGKISGVTYIKSGGKVIGAHADRKTLNLKAEYEKPRNGVRKTKRELLWTQKYVCSRAGLPKKKSEEEAAQSSASKEAGSSRKKSVSKKCGCQSRIVISVYADDKSLAVVRKIADHSAHMTTQQLEDLKQNYQRHFCLIHSNLQMSGNSNNYPHTDDASLLLSTSNIANQQHHHQQQVQHQPTFMHSSNSNLSFDSQHMNQNTFTLPTPQIKKETELFNAYQYNHQQSRFNTLVANLN